MSQAPTQWTAEFEAGNRALVERLVSGQGRERMAAWQRFLQLIAPHVEQWASRHRVLRAVRLTSEDEVRAVLVRVVERLQRDDHRNLREFVQARGPMSLPIDDDGEVLERFGALSELVDDQAESADLLTNTPLRAWLKTLVDFAARDHATARLGRRNVLHTPTDTGPNDKRQVNSDARPISESDVGSVRPPITDLLTLKRIVQDVSGFIQARLPSDQRRALELRLDDATYGEIAKQLDLPKASDAEALVRAAKERLRAEFREQRSKFGLETN
ncbi:MAG: sigma-70 region 4 domain-containing protein [Deltaproteobacteria bacterium]|nr:sigma-70 region 4 domain-containing protein [Deltaproteobacteria bacterium]